MLDAEHVGIDLARRVAQRVLPDERWHPDTLEDEFNMRPWLGVSQWHPIFGDELEAENTFGGFPLAAHKKRSVFHYNPIKFRCELLRNSLRHRLDSQNIEPRLSMKAHALDNPFHFWNSPDDLLTYCLQVV